MHSQKCCMELVIIATITTEFLKNCQQIFRNGNFMPYRFRPLAKKEMSGEQELKIQVSVEGKKPTTSTIEQYQIDSYFKMGWKLDLVWPRTTTICNDTTDCKSHVRGWTMGDFFPGAVFCWHLTPAHALMFSLAGKIRPSFPCNLISEAWERFTPTRLAICYPSLVSSDF